MFCLKGYIVVYFVALLWFSMALPEQDRQGSGVGGPRVGLGVFLVVFWWHLQHVIAFFWMVWVSGGSTQFYPSHLFLTTGLAKPSMVYLSWEVTSTVKNGIFEGGLLPNRSHSMVLSRYKSVFF